MHPDQIVQHVVLQGWPLPQHFYDQVAQSGAQVNHVIQNNHPDAKKYSVGVQNIPLDDAVFEQHLAGMLHDCIQQFQITQVGGAFCTRHMHGQFPVYNLWFYAV